MARQNNSIIYTDSDGRRYRVRVSGQRDFVCSTAECTNKARRDGVCVRHGAAHPRCSVDGCASQVQAGGVCVAHGYISPRCHVNGCPNQAVMSGMCSRHGAGVLLKRCSASGCKSKAKVGGLCVRHGANVPRCIVEGCMRLVDRKGETCAGHLSGRADTDRRGWINDSDRTYIYQGVAGDGLPFFGIVLASERRLSTAVSHYAKHGGDVQRIWLIPSGGVDLESRIKHIPDRPRGTIPRALTESLHPRQLPIMLEMVESHLQMLLR